KPRNTPTSASSVKEGGSSTCCERATTDSTPADSHSMRLGSGDSVASTYSVCPSLRTFHRPGPGSAPETTTVWWSTIWGPVSGSELGSDWIAADVSTSTGDTDCACANAIGGNSSRARHSIL